MKFKTYDELSKELDKLPGEENIILEDNILWLKQDYAINRMNYIYGESNWSIENIRKSELKNENGEIFGYTCILTVSYTDPISGDLGKMDGISGTSEAIDNNIIGRAFLNAISHIGKTFGANLLHQFD